jgi:DNA-binding transcriptional MerR regulator
MVGDVSEVTEDVFTIDELARRVGMTARNVRAYQSRGLIQPPKLRGRTGYYGPEHVARLELIRDLQAEGFNLGAIKRILERADGRSVSEVLDFTRALAAPFSDEQPVVVEAQFFEERWGDQITTDVVRRSQQLGLVRDLGDGRYELRSPRLVRVAEELTDLGVPLEVALDMTGTLKRHAEAIARAYVELFLDHVWHPFERAGEPDEEWPEVRDALDRLRPLAGEAVLGMFGLVMTDAVEQAMERELSRLASGHRPSTRGRRRRSRSSHRRRSGAGRS